MTWREPLPESTSVSGYSLFQTLNTNESGEIDPIGSNIVEKYYNPSTVDIIYKQFIPPVFRYLFTEGNAGGDFHRIINAVDPNKALTETLSAHSGTASNSDIRMAWNNGDDWFIDRRVRYFHSEDGGDSWTQAAIFGTKLSHSIPAILNNTPYFVDRNDNQVYKWEGGAFVATSGQPDTSNITLNMGMETTSNIVLRSIFDHDGKLYAVGLGDAGGDTRVSEVLYMSDDAGATWTRTRVFIFEDNLGAAIQFENIDGGSLFSVKPIGTNKLFVHGQLSPNEFMFLVQYTGSLDTVDTVTTFPSVQVSTDYVDTLDIPNISYYDGKILVTDAVGTAPEAYVIENSITNKSSIFSTLYPPPDLEWYTFTNCFEDANLVRLGVNIFDAFTGNEIYAIISWNLTDDSTSFIYQDTNTFLTRVYQSY